MLDDAPNHTQVRAEDQSLDPGEDEGDQAKVLSEEHPDEDEVAYEAYESLADSACNQPLGASIDQPPKVAFDDDATYYWMLDTNVGNMKVKLMPDVAPMHVSSTLYLTQLGFYDDIVFHRVIPGFMAQSGDPTGTGTSGPGYQYAGEFDKDVKHDKGGLLSMANRGPGTDSSQFFLTFVPTPHLNGKHTIFGEVVEGRGTLKALEKRGSRRGKTSERLLIEKATILVE